MSKRRRASRAGRAGRGRSKKTAPKRTPATPAPESARQPAEAVPTSAERPTSDGVARVPPFNSRQLLLLGVILMVGAGLRLFKLGNWSLWVDEAHTFRDVTRPWDEFWSAGVSNYPIGYLLLRGLLSQGVLPGHSEGWLRLPFAFAGILSVPALAVFGRSVVGRGAALLGAALLALSPWHIYWSQNARGYALTVLFGILAGFGAHRALRDRSLWLVLCSTLCAVLAGLAHPSGFMMLGVLAGVLAYGVWRDGGLVRRYRLQLGLSGGVAFVAAAAWLLPAVATAMAKKPGFSTVHFVQTLAFFVGVPLLAAAGAGIVTMLRGRRLDSLSIAAAWVALPIGALLACSLFMQVTAQYALVVLPGICLLAGRFAVDVAESIGERSWTSRVAGYGLPLVLVLWLLGDAFLYATKQHGQRPRWGEAAAAVAADSGPVERCVVTTNTPSMRYYFDRPSFFGASTGTTEIVGVTPWDLEDAGGAEPWLDELNAFAFAEGRSLHFVITEPELAEWDRDGSLNRALRERGAQIARLTCWAGPKDMTVLVYRLPVTEPLPESEPADEQVGDGVGGDRDTGN